jgi:hypothetical protein
MNWLAWWRRRGWQEIDIATYATAYNQFGGSVITHPEFITKISHLVGIPLHFYGHFENNKLLAAVPVWEPFFAGAYIAGHRRALKRAHQDNNVDLGNMEIILPIATGVAAMPLKFSAHYISAINALQIKALRPAAASISMLKSYSKAEFSKKFLYNRNRELRLFNAAGGAVHHLAKYSTADIAQWYVNLFEKRWQKKPKAYASIHLQLEAVKNFLTGYVLFFNDQPVALQLVFRAESPQWVSYEYVNAGINPAYKNFSLGSILTFLNTQQAEAYANAQGKQLRYSFGRSDAAYKTLWCNSAPLYKT